MDNALIEVCRGTEALVGDYFDERSFSSDDVERHNVVSKMVFSNCSKVWCRIPKERGDQDLILPITRPRGGSSLPKGF